MNRTNYSLGTNGQSRCSVCTHPDREAIDKALILKRETQADVARAVDVDRSTVSRHVKNHVLPALARGVLMETKDVAIGSIVEAFDRTYAETQVLYERAMLKDDLRLAATMLDQQRRILETVVRYSSKMGHATLQDVMGRDSATDREYMEGVRASLGEKLESLADRNFRVTEGPAATDDDHPGDPERDMSDETDSTPLSVSP